MRKTRIFITTVTTTIALAILLGNSGRLIAQEHGVTPADIERGGQTFLANCASCHGPNGDGVTGVNLASGHFNHATTDQDLINIIQSGIPGTPMPPFNLRDAQAGQIVAYLRTLPATFSASQTIGLRGDAANGKLIVEGKGECLSCHRMKTPSGITGGFLGPELSDMGATRRSIDLERALTNPGAAIRTNNRVARVVTKDGATILGRLLNQETYSVQLIDGEGNLRSFQKSSVRQVEILNV
jgi:putative heme-binding domain-containing protein